MAVTPTAYVKTVVWNAITWSATAEGGPLELRISDASTTIRDRTGDSIYPTASLQVDHDCTATLRLREVKQTIAIATKSNMVCTITDGEGTDVVITLANMKFEGQTPVQGRAQFGEVELSFVHESSDGQTDPLT